MRTFLILFIIFMTVSCAKNPVEKADEAIDIALSYLSDGECDDAIKVLLDAGIQSSNGVYLQVLASAYACKANFDEIQFISDDLAALDTTSGQTIVKSLSTMSLSNETAADSTAYTSILRGINIILTSTSGSPGQIARNDKFGSRRAGDMGVQALILNLVNFGKFLQFYGNTNASGTKGAGSGTNSCFIDYTDNDAQAVVSGGTTGACTVNNDGHADLDLSTAAGKRRICEGIMLLTNALDILDNLDLSTTSTLSKLEDVSSQVETFRTSANGAGLGTIMSMTSQSACEAYAAVPAQLADIEYFVALVFEVGLQ